jgi:hypothetical protein
MAGRIEDAMGDTTLAVGFDATTDEFKAATNQMMQAWKTGTSAMDEETRVFATKAREALTSMGDEFTKSTTEGFEAVRASFRNMADMMLDDWKVAMVRMTAEVERLNIVTRQAMSEMQSAFAANVANNLSLATQSASAYRAPTQVNATLELDRVQFGRMVYQIGDEESQRVGVKLAGGYA